MPGLIALVGSGEYLPEMATIEGRLLNGGSRYIQIPTAAAQEGTERLDYWIELGRQAATRLGATQVTVAPTNREEANDPKLAKALDGAALIYLSGGNPTFLADTLRDTLVWEAIVAAYEGGASIAGCSAGAMVMGGWIPSLRNRDSPGHRGLGLLPHLSIIPHFDRFVPRLGTSLAKLALRPPTGIEVVGIDELTALVGTASSMTVMGKGTVLRLNESPPRRLHKGESIVL
ncbi:Type 1 glutamine amidotransferase-like domain-containing protein [Ferrimicrobium sp.]|uniref:Type 1 glutamine amidotransferase-like domain-containing protein n=1 Tax=Ferrimicrobium sp. TaxID=2926050 RepID=UPI00261A0D7E|nr:Type 1 glutamine amidotransferase-like domain-containing protein [Ferrimicrobium sp.]